TESVIRTLSELKNNGYVIIKGRSIFLKDIKGLMKIAGIYT
ncbi:MAG: Crp/Fnr family transcriptional regulator, partial [Bacteroidetes bacterium CG_4_8_14_3_um_filter_31_14]